MSKEMFVITDCEVAIVPGLDYFYNSIQFEDDKAFVEAKELGSDRKVNVTTKHVRGRVYKSPDGRDFTIGITDEAGEKLGIIYKDLELKDRELARMSEIERENISLRMTIRKLKRESIFGHIARVVKTKTKVIKSKINLFLGLIAL